MFIEEQFGIFLVPTPYQTKVHPMPPVPPADMLWLDAVRRDIVTINKSKVGNALLRSIKWHGIVITIHPMKPGECGDGTWPIENDIGSGDPNLIITTGPNIWFSPQNHDLNHKCEAKYQVFGQLRIESHEVLLHELVHAFRMTSSKLNTAGVRKGFAFYNTNEEIYAVTVQGIYASEIGRAIRSSHTGHHKMDSNLDSSFEFFQTGSESFEYIKKFCLDNPGFTRMVSEVRTKFNPIRAYYHDPARAMRLSLGPVAKSRDTVQPVLRSGLSFLKSAFRQAGLTGP